MLIAFFMFKLKNSGFAMLSNAESGDPDIATLPRTTFASIID